MGADGLALASAAVQGTRGGAAPLVRSARLTGERGPPDTRAVMTVALPPPSEMADHAVMEAEAVARIVERVGTALRERPDAQVIAVDEPHALRLLGRLGDALRPLGLGGRRVALSVRPEHALEARSDIEEALGGRFPAPIELSFVGPENFSQGELERLHKGASVAQIERAHELARAFAERYPGRLRATPSDQLVLFTPWTTLEDLRVNASVLRRPGFERYRGPALVSRLRLEPGTPLHEFARGDGLLADGAAARAAGEVRGHRDEDGAPWRFRDAKVAAVYQTLLAARAGAGIDLFEAFEDALDDAAGVARGKKHRPLRMVRAPRDGERGGSMTRAIALNRACNQRCGFCSYRAASDEPPRLRAARAISAVRAAAQQGARAVMLTGAEPLLEWYLEDLVRLARDLGVPAVVLETNATLLAGHGDGDPRRGAAALAAAGVTRAIVAMNALDPAISDAITRDPGGHGRTVEGVRALLAAGIAVELAVALLPENRGALAEIAARARVLFPATAAGVEGVVARCIPAGERHPRPLGVADAAAELAAGAEAAARSGVPLRSAPGGELPPCAFADPGAVTGVLRLGEEIVQRDAAQYRRIEACGACSAARVCPGPHRAVAAAVAAAARPLGEEIGRLGSAALSGERQRVLKEYRSQFFIETPGGKARERRVVRVNFHCNQACDFCFVSRELPQVDHELIVREIREAAERQAILDLSGGEPTLNPRLAEYIALARELGVPELELQTNAVKMADPEYARSLWDAGLRQAFVSLHGTSAKVSDRVTAAPGTFEKTVAGVRNLRALGMLVRLNFVLCGYNIEDLAALPDFVAAELDREEPGPGYVLNFSFVAASTDNVPRDTGLIPRFSDVAWALAAAHERASRLGLEMMGFDSKCGVPACYMPAAIREEHFGCNIPEEELARATGFTKSEACVRCDFERRCYGIRSSYAELYGTGELRPVSGGERAPPGQSTAPRTGHRGTVWAAIGLSPAHSLRAGSTARLVDDTAFRRHPDAWFGEEADADQDRELVQLDGGLREVLKVERGSVAAAEETAARMRGRGLVVSVYTGPPGPGGSPPRAIAFVGRSEAAVREAMELEPELTRPFRERDALVRRMGRLLGYPACCVEVFAASSAQDDATHLARLAAAHTRPLAPEQNWAATPLRPFSHFPCTPTCAETSRLGRATLALMRPRHRAALERALQSVVLLCTVDRFALLMGGRAVGPGEFAYSGVLSHKNLGVEDAILSRPLVRAFYLEVVAPLEEGDHVARRATSLVVSREGRRVGEVQFAGAPPPLLDFTAERAVRRLPLALA